MSLLSDLAWYERPLRILDFIPPAEEQVLSHDYKKSADLKADLAFNAEHMEVMDITFRPDRIFYFKSSAANRVPRDVLTEYLPMARSHGIKQLIYINVHTLAEDSFAKFPDWTQRAEDGQALKTLYGLGYFTCPSSPSYTDWTCQVIKDLAKYDIDGIFLDGPFVSQHGCYCDGCQALYKELYNEKLPSYPRAGSPDWMKWIEHHMQSVERYCRKCRDTLKSVRPDAIIYSNGSRLDTGFGQLGRSNYRMMEYQDILGAEGGFLGGVIDDIPPYKVSMTAKVIEAQSRSKPTVVFISGRHGRWSRYIHPPTQTTLLSAQAVANGANIWYGIYEETADRPGVKAQGEFNRFLAENETYYTATRPVARVGILVSEATVHCYAQEVFESDFTAEATSESEGPGYVEEFSGIYRALVRKHIPFVAVEENELDDQLQPLDVLYLPNTACLTDKVFARLISFVEAGGTIIASSETGFFTEDGSRREQSQIMKLLGIKPLWKQQGPLTQDYMQINEHAGAHFSTGQPLLPSPLFRILIEPVPDTEALAFYYEPAEACYCELPACSPYPAMTHSKLGKGRVYYFAGNLAQTYEKYRFVDFEDIIADPALKYATPLIKLKNCPASVEVSLRKNEQGLMIHLVNLNFDGQRPTRRVVPVGPLEVTIRNCSAVTDQGRLLRSQQRIKPTCDTDSVSFAIDSLVDYEVAVLQGCNI